MYAFVNFASPLVLQSQSQHTAFRPRICKPSAFTTPFQTAKPCIRHAKFYMSGAKPDDKKESFNPIQREFSREVKELHAVLKKCSLYLVGPMGCGKSVVGKYLSYELGFRYLDTDAIVESVAKKSISQIFEDDGEQDFRDLESAVLEQVTPFLGCVVSTGGGIVVRKENWGKLQTGIVIYLDTPVHVLQDRLQTEQESEKRPLLKDAVSLRDRITDIMTEREHLYKHADVSIHCEAGAPVDNIGKDVIRTLTNFIKSNPPKLSTLFPGNLSK